MIGRIELTEDHCPVSGQYRIITGRDGLYEEGEI